MCDFLLVFRSNCGLHCFISEIRPDQILVEYAGFLPCDAAMIARSWEVGSRNSVRPSHACFATNPKNLPTILLYYMKG